MLSIEAVSVVAAAMLVWLSALVQHFANVAVRGFGYVTGDRSQAPSMDGFYGRATRTLANNLESAAMYVPATLIVLMAGQLTSLTRLTALAYVVARVIFTVSYWLRIPHIRSFAWLAGMICAAIMIVSALISAWPNLT